METAAANYHHHAPAPLPNRARRKDSRTHVASAVRLRPNITKPIINLNKNRFRDLRVFCLNTVTEHMGTKINLEPIKEENIKINEEEEEEEEEQKSKKIVPPPPEKPEPGDCCGTGCVRCVWDVYFEELDAYHKLYDCDDSNDIQN